MATATTQARTGRGRDQRSGEGVPSEFVVFESNSGEYRWEIVSGSGATLAQSLAFTSFEGAEAAAVLVREGAGSTRLDSRGAAGQATSVLVGSRSRAVKGR
jgi:uncharacterized protein YegP (UPF0339 family)